MSGKTGKLIVFSVVIPLFTIMHGLKGAYIADTPYWLAYGISMLGVLLFSGNSKSKR